jgi:hypothetical protein
MEKLMTYSIEDLGYPLVPIEQADVVIYIQYADEAYRTLHSEQKHVLLQVEDWIHRPAEVKSVYSPNTFDKVWGFDIEHPYEDYFYLGYNERLDYGIKPQANAGIAFMGGITQRRKDILENTRNKYNWIAEWDNERAMNICSSFKINVHIHAYEPTVYTPWDRFARYLHNGIYFVSEVCYSPLAIGMFRYGEYDTFMNRVKAYPVEDIIEFGRMMKSEYVDKFNMAKQMERKLKEVLCAIKPV